MANKEKMIAIYIPESLIPELAGLTGPITLYMDKLHVNDGFAHAGDEFVTSLNTLRAVIKLAGVTPETFAIISGRT
ncbi:TPA: hypothetical protein QIF36_002374 [Enterobacter kobei]|nr:hypothetical protein [Enterobacter kobei]